MDENKTTLTAPAGEAAQLDVAYVIAKIDQIMADSENLRKTLELLENRPINGEGVIGVGNMIEARERTNQAMIDLLKRIVVQILPGHN